MNWLRRKFGMRRLPKAAVRAVWLDRLNLRCPACNKGGILLLPEGFSLAIDGGIAVSCPDGHYFRMEGEKSENEPHEAQN